MAISRKRDEVVVFRLTDQELVSLKRVCAAKGGRNLSEFARTELLSSAHAIEVAWLKEKIAAVEELLCRMEDNSNALARQLRFAGALCGSVEKISAADL
jgi:hypothetical protein